MPHRLRLLRQMSNNIMDRILTETVIISGVKSSHLGAKISVEQSRSLGFKFLARCKLLLEDDCGDMSERWTYNFGVCREGLPHMTLFPKSWLNIELISTV